MTNAKPNLNRGEKILAYLYELGEKQKKRILYEDIVVGLFNRYPSDFHLKGYPQYPDSSDSTQRSLYKFKQKGYISVSNKIFSLTDQGLEFARHLAERDTPDNDIPLGRLSRATAVELERIKKLEGLYFFMENRTSELTENDFYNYLGITVRTTASAFSGRLQTIQTVIKELEDVQGDTLVPSIIEYHNYLLKKNKTAIDYFLKK